MITDEGVEMRIVCDILATETPPWNSEAVVQFDRDARSLSTWGEHRNEDLARGRERMLEEAEHAAAMRYSRLLSLLRYCLIIRQLIKA